MVQSSVAEHRFGYSYKIHVTRTFCIQIDLLFAKTIGLFFQIAKIRTFFMK